MGRKEATVWVIQPPTKGGVDYSSASRYGLIQFLLDPEDSGSSSPTIVLNKLRKAVKEIKPEDYLVWAGGDPWNNFLAGWVMGELKEPRSVNILVWERERSIDGTPNKNGFYYPLKINRYQA